METVHLFKLFSLLTVQYFLNVCEGTIFKVKQSTAVEMSTSAAETLMHLEVTEACNSTATLSWTLEEEDSSQRHQSSLCDLTYYHTGDTSAKMFDILFDSRPHSIRLFNLTEGKSYTAFVVCGGVMTTNQVFFISDSDCQEKDTLLNQTAGSLHASTSQTPVYFHASKFDLVEWPVAVTFVLVGLIIATFVAFYMWKKYQRRQRILRIFRQGQNDPFQALYSPTQDSYSF